MAESHQPPQNLAALHRQREALEGLLRSDGWQVLEAYLSGVEQGLLDKVTSSLVLGDSLHRVAGGLAQVREVRNWPRAQLRAFQQQLEQKR